MLRRLATTLALALCAAPAAAQQEEDADSSRWPVAPRPKAPVIVRGACPFECCQYGRWVLRDTAVLRSRPRRDARVVARLPFGAEVRTDSGFVRIDTIGVVVLRERYVDSMNGIQYAPGDSLLVLDYVGEGVINAWLRGRAVQTELFWEGAPRIARTVRDVHAEWWVRVRDRRGRKGWIDMSITAVEGADACDR